MPDGAVFNAAQGQGLASGASIPYATQGGNSTPAFVASATPAAVKAGAGRLCRILCTVAGTAATTFYDNASAATGNVLYRTKAACAVGDIYDVQVAAVNGIYADQPASSAGFTVSYW